MRTITLSPLQVAILIEALGVCVNSDTYLDDPLIQLEAESLLTELEAVQP